MKPLHWIGSSKKDLIAMPDAVKDEMGHTLYLVQEGDTPTNVNLSKALAAQAYSK